MKLKIIIVYKTKDNKEPFKDWILSLGNIIRARIFVRIKLGN